MTIESTPYRRNVVLPRWLDRLSVRVARWPWWIIIIAVGLILVFYAILTDNVYREALDFLTDKPVLITSLFTNVSYNVQDSQGNITPLRGIVTAETEQTVTVLIQSELQSIIPRDDIASLTCPNDPCQLNDPVTVVRSQITGKLLQENRGNYEVATDYGVTVRVFRISTSEAIKTPEGCIANREGTCRVVLKLIPEEQPELRPEEQTGIVKGVLVDDRPGHVTVQVRPAESATIDKANIVGNIAAPTPAQCALNNIAACDEGIFLTFGVAILAFAVANVIGLIFGLMRISNNTILTNLATVYVEVVRGIPLLVILLFVEFSFAPAFRDTFPEVAPRVIQIIVVIAGVAIAYNAIMRLVVSGRPPGAMLFPVLWIGLMAGAAVIIALYFRANSRISPPGRAVIGLAFCYGAYLAELFRAGIQSIGRGQMEAARSLGMNYVQSMFYVILPQAFRVVLPPLGNEFIAMLKDTSLIAILALPELTQKARLFAADKLLPFQPYITAAVLYLCMTLFLSFLVRVVERRVALPR